MRDLDISYNSYNSNVISDATLARAIRFTSYLIPHALAAYAEIGTDPAVEGARLVLRWPSCMVVSQPPPCGVMDTACCPVSRASGPGWPCRPPGTTWTRWCSMRRRGGC